MRLLPLQATRHILPNEILRFLGTCHSVVLERQLRQFFFQSFCVLEARRKLSFKTLACKRQNNTIIFLFEILFYYIIL